MRESAGREKSPNIIYGGTPEGLLRESVNGFTQGSFSEESKEGSYLRKSVNGSLNGVTRPHPLKGIR